MNPIRDEWTTEDGSIRLLLGDCLEILPGLGKVDAVVTDPPYGIGAGREKPHNGWKDYGIASWDLSRPESSAFDLMRVAGKAQIIWGGNYFTDFLPPSGRWLIWDKCQTDFSLADAELAWCSFDGAVRRINYPRAKALQDGKEHPTQKPIAVMEWCLGFLPDAHTILDPFMGSGTTGVACIRLGRRFVGIEKEPKYFEIAKRRIRDELDKTRLIEKPKKLVQRGFLEPAACGPS